MISTLSLTVLCGGLIDGFITNCVCYFFKKLKEEKKLTENIASNREIHVIVAVY